MSLINAIAEIRFGAGYAVELGVVLDDQSV
jgi:hypothetical protein